MNFQELLNCLVEIDNTIKSMGSELNTTRKSLEESKNLISELQRITNDKQDIIARLDRQSIAQRVIGVALCFDMQDIQYKFGGTWDKDKQFDCSAFMQICFRVGTQGMVALPRTSHDQSWAGVDIPFDKIEPGDTLHYDFDGDGKVTHVGLAMDNVWMIHTNNPENDINIIRIMDYNNGKGLVRVRRHIGV